MHWKRLTSEPVSTEKRLAVYCQETGAEGWVSIFWENRPATGHRVVFAKTVDDFDGRTIDAAPKFV